MTMRILPRQALSFLTAFGLLFALDTGAADASAAAHGKHHRTVHAKPPHAKPSKATRHARSKAAARKSAARKTSPAQMQPVLDAVADSARLLCGSDHVHVHMKDGNELVTRASASAPEAAGTLSELRIPIDLRSAAGRAVLESRTVHLPNVMSLDAVHYGKAQELAKVGGFGTLLSAPMIRDGAAVGVITLPSLKA